jgi:D-amino peptidase
MMNRPGILIVLLIATALVAAACAAGDTDTVGSEPVAPDVAAGAAAQAGRVLSDPAPLIDGRIRVLVYHDMEGLSGQNDWRTFDFGHPGYYAQGRRLLTDDVNAVVDGLFAGGADVVHVVDAHGSGNPEPDILLDELDNRAEMVFRDTPFRPYVDLADVGDYDAVAVVGMHAKTGAGGFASHTYTLGMDLIMNGMSITETELIGYSWGRVDVPVIFASGDDKLRANLATMPWIEYVEVKQATSASTANLMPVEDAHEQLRAGARRALENREQARAMRLTVPITATLRAVPPAGLERLDGVPGIDYRDSAVTFEAGDFQDAYDGLISLIRVGTTTYPDVLIETLQGLPDGPHLLSLYEQHLMERWLDHESGRWVPSDRTFLSGERRRYHGAR